jgi:hypothetical protein
MHHSKAILGAAALALTFASAEAQVVIGYNFGSTGGFTTASTSGTAANFSVGSFSIANSLGTVTGTPNAASAPAANTYTIPAGDGGGSNSSNGNYGNAVAIGALNTSTTAYYSVTLTPSAGYLLQVSSFDFGTRSTSTGPQSYSIRSSVDNYGSDIATGSIANNSTWTFKQNTFSSTLVGSTDTAITLRLYTFGGAGSPTSGTINNRIDDVFIGITAVPEPSIYAVLSGVGLLGFGLWRRRGQSRR